MLFPFKYGAVLDDDRKDYFWASALGIPILKTSRKFHFRLEALTNDQAGKNIKRLSVGKMSSDDCAESVCPILLMFV